MNCIFIYFLFFLNQPTSYQLQDVEGEECLAEGDCEEEETCLYPCRPKKKLLSVHIRPHVGSLSDYPYCITPQQIVC